MPEKNKRAHQTSASVRVIDRGNILLLLAVMILFGAIMLWIMAGSIRTSFKSAGFVTSSENTIAIHQPDNALVTDIKVDLGEYVHKGDTLLKLYPIEEGADLSLDEMSAEAHDIASPVNGYVVEITASRWDKADVSTTLMRVLEADTPELNNIISYVSFYNIDDVKIGTPVKVSGKKDSAVGAMNGKVIGIKKYPMAYNDMLSSIGSENIVRLFYQADVEQYEVLIALDPYEEDLQEAEKSLECNYICDVVFYSDKMRPYQMMFTE